MIRFELPFALPTLNAMLREAKRGPKARGRKAQRTNLAWWVIAGMGSHQRPRQPIPRAHIHVERYGLRAVDEDNLRASVKPLLDILQPLSIRHKAGLGVILNDSKACLISQTVTAIRVSDPADQRTVVTITEAD